MNKEVFVIQYHSIVCEITNSSTELFMLDTDKAIEMVEQLVKEKEKEYPPDYGHYVSVNYGNEWYLKEIFGYYEDEDVIRYLEAKGYIVTPPEDPNKKKYICITSERGGMHPELANFIRNTFNVISYGTEF